MERTEAVSQAFPRSPSARSGLSEWPSMACQAPCVSTRYGPKKLVSRAKRCTSARVDLPNRNELTAGREGKRAERFVDASGESEQRTDVFAMPKSVRSTLADRGAASTQPGEMKPRNQETFEWFPHTAARWAPVRESNDFGSRSARTEPPEWRPPAPGRR